jgi:hypothetical protein
MPKSFDYFDKIETVFFLGKPVYSNRRWDCLVQENAVIIKATVEFYYGESHH